ncbi:MAG: helix-turn-helix domain-containing protein, partial [Candidatus Cloacimonetes bacterium]|nr:helix-turn-helix domain-containing protein [Candidatus Cloacimonadota bacterium]
MAKDEILTLNEAAKFLNMSPETLVNLVSQKELKGIKVGNQWRFIKEEIEAWK